MEPVLIVLIVFSSVAFMLKTMLDYRRSKLIAGPAEKGTLGTSELRLMIQEAVAEAVQPLVDRLDATENQVNSNSQRMLDEPLRDIESVESLD